MPLGKALRIVLGTLPFLSGSTYAQGDPNAARPGPTPQSMADANLVQSVVSCMHDFEVSSKNRREIVALSNGQTFAAFNWKEHLPPRLTGSKFQCSFAVVVDRSTSNILAYPVCKVGADWRVFGSGYGPIIWAKPSLACQGSKGPVIAFGDLM